MFFFEQRRYHHFGSDRDAESMVYFHALVEAIREQLGKSSQPDEPETTASSDFLTSVWDCGVKPGPKAVGARFSGALVWLPVAAGVMALFVRPPRQP